MSKSKFVRVGVDLDGVVADFCYSFSSVLRKLYGEHLPLITDDNSVLAWNWHEWYPITKEEEEKAWTHIIKNETNFWETLPLLDSVGWQSLKELQLYDNVVVYFVTSRAVTPGRSIVKQSCNWLKKHGWVDPQVIVSSAKGNIIKHVGIKYFIDDKYENCEEIYEMNPTCNVFVMNRRHNSKKHTEGIDRLFSLNEYLVKILEDINE